MCQCSISVWPVNNWKGRQHQIRTPRDMADDEDQQELHETTPSTVETEEELYSRHRKEVRELAGKITSMKKSVGKGAASAKKKKEIMEEIAKLGKYTCHCVACILSGGYILCDVP